MRDAGPWYSEYRWLGLVAVLLFVGGIVALLALSGGDKGQVQSGGSPIAVSTGPPTSEPETVEIPDVVGTQYPDAVDQLLDAGLLPESVPVESTEKRGTVVAERPAAGTQAKLAAGVRIDVSLGSGAREERQVPDLTGLSISEALRVCADAGFTCRAVPAGGTGREVAAERPVAGRPVELSQIELSTG